MPFPSPLPPLASWNADVMAIARAAIMDHEMRATC